MITRRSLTLAGCMAGMAPQSLIAQNTSGDPLSDSDLDEIFLADAEQDYQITEPSLLGLSREKFNYYAGLIETGNISPKWAADVDSIDFAHLKENIDSSEFEMTVDDLLALATSNNFTSRLDSDNFAFGLRGCSIIPTKSSGTSIRLKEMIPDHLNFKCVIGSANLKNKSISGFRASTVPNAVYMEVQRQGLEGCNLLPTGLHIYEVGTHGASFAPLRRQPGALRQINGVAVLRAKNNLVYTNKEHWDTMEYAPHYPSDNIHAAVLDVRAKPPYFSSKGCQVLPGTYSPLGSKPTGTFAQWRLSIGLSDPPMLSPPEYGRRVPYMLLTGREARLVVNGKWRGPKSERLRFGSAGPRVAKLREKLLLPPGSVFDRQTMVRWISWQQEKLGWADGIVWPEHAAIIGV